MCVICLLAAVLCYLCGVLSDGREGATDTEEVQSGNLRSSVVLKQPKCNTMVLEVVDTKWQRFRTNCQMLLKL